MKVVGWCLLCLVFCFELCAQTDEFIHIVQHKTIGLDSRGSALFSGRQTAVIELDLPPNTVKWYYRFYNVTKEELISKYGKSINFLEDVKSQKDAVSPIFKTPYVPTEFKNKVSVYLLEDSAQVVNFEKTITFTKTSYLEDFSMLNQYSGWEEVSHPHYINGLQYLGLVNHANISATHMMLDVVAVCKKRSIHPLWKESSLKKAEQDWIQFAINEIPTDFLESYSNCFLEKLQYSSTEDVFLSSSPDSKEKLYTEIYGKCAANEHLMQCADTSLQIISPYRLFGKWKTEKGELLQLNPDNEIQLQKNNGEMLSGWWYISDESLIIGFENYKTQKYQPVFISPYKMIWKNRLTGNYLRSQRIKL